MLLAPARAERLSPRRSRLGTYSRATSIGMAGTTTHARNARACGMQALSSLPRLIEISQIRGRLVPAGRHQISVDADEVAFLADDDMSVFFVADILRPDRIKLAPVAPCHCPRTSQCVVENRDL